MQHARHTRLSSSLRRSDTDIASSCSHCVCCCLLLWLCACLYVCCVVCVSKEKRTRRRQGEGRLEKQLLGVACHFMPRARYHDRGKPLNLELARLPLVKRACTHAHGQAARGFLGFRADLDDRKGKHCRGLPLRWYIALPNGERN